MHIYAASQTICTNTRHEVDEYENEFIVAPRIMEHFQKMEETISEEASTDDSEKCKTMKDKDTNGMVAYGAGEDINSF